MMVRVSWERGLVGVSGSQNSQTEWPLASINVGGGHS